MPSRLDNKDTQRLEALASILGRCFCITVAALLFVWLVVIAFGEPVHRLHNMMIEISRPQFDLLVLVSLTFIKSLNVVLFLFPFVAIKHFLRVQKGLEPAND